MSVLRFLSARDIGAQATATLRMPSEEIAAFHDGFSATLAAASRVAGGHELQHSESTKTLTDSDAPFALRHSAILAVSPDMDGRVVAVARRKD